MLIFAIRLLVDWAGSSVLRFRFLSERNGLVQSFSVHWAHAMCQHLSWVHCWAERKVVVGR